jgi:monoamine oxidase/predicted heme/steroid binding protein
MYDVVIVGGGITGLYSCYSILKSFPTTKVCVIEQSGRWGGRVYTKYKDGLSFESGAGRFHSSHKTLMTLLKEFNLQNDMIQLSDNVSYFLKGRWIHNDTELMAVYNSSFKSLKKMWQYLYDNAPRNNSLTLYEYCRSIGLSKSEADCLKDTFGYDSEFTGLNAKNALDIIEFDFYKGTYYVLKGGLQRLIDLIVDKCKKMGADMILNKTCISVDETDKMIKTDDSHTYKYKKCILSVPISALDTIKFNKQLKWTYKPEPYKLCRIYAKYPEPWFKGMAKMISDLKISMVIPVNPNNGLIMISYSDTEVAEYWNSFMSEKELTASLNKDLRKLFKNIEIPEPEWISVEYWNEGCHTWGKNANDFVIMNDIQKQLDNNIFLANEAYCHLQGWIEGSLLMVDSILNEIYTQLGGVKTYTVEEVSKHISKETGIWTIIEGKVYDITKWIPQHPGGVIPIMRIAGKDGTDLFKNNPFHKGKNTEVIIKNYLIGIIR